jgi:CRP-like cAMP-binding protein
MARSKLATFVKNFEPMVCLNKQVIYRQGEPKRYIYIVRQGEFRLTKRMKVKNSSQEASKLNEKPSQHAVDHS